jgi:hypothetical protein
MRHNPPSLNPRSRLQERGVESESDFAGGYYSAEMPAAATEFADYFAVKSTKDAVLPI